ncbi:MAG: LIC12162 family protein [Syntrophorhabdaceae bacterium]|nr:LIC12162 family protein [Syntrophorhabdaceae bacterium]
MYDKKIFLATTSIEEFWDTSAKLLFLGEWCRRYSRREYLKSLDTIALDPPYSDADVPGIFTYLDDVYERALPVLSGTLNSLHGVDYSERYWRILVGTWLLHFIHVAYDRYLHISKALASYPELATVCLDEVSFETPESTIDFMELLKGDTYNLQLFSRIMRKLNRSFPEMKMDREQYAQVSVQKVSPNGAVSLTKRVVAKFFSSLGDKETKVFYHNAYFSRNVEIRLLLRTRFTLSPFFCPDVDFGGGVQQKKSRKAIRAVSFGENEFERMLFDLISGELPVTFVEKYDEIRDSVNGLYRHKPVALMSATSWHYHDVFKIWAGSQAERGTLLIGLQHGGNYGIIRYFLQEQQELSSVDRFYSWGWTRSGTRAVVRPLSATKLIGRKKMRRERNSPDVLYDLAVWLRCLIQFPLTTEYWQRYFQDINVFAENLSDKVRSNMRLRPHREDMGWDVRERLGDAFPGNVRIETWDVPFTKSLNNCCLFLCGHPMYSTTFIEALHIDKPTILFCDPSFAANMLHPDAVEYYSDLRRAGILFDGPVDAAREVNRVYENVDEWWSEDGRQKAVRRFIGRFGRVSVNALDEWVTELRGIGNGREYQHGH